MGVRPRFAAVVGFALEGFAGVRRVVVSDVDDQFPVRRLDRVEFVVFLVVVTLAGRDFGEPLPGLAVVEGLADADLVFSVAKSSFPRRAGDRL